MLVGVMIGLLIGAIYGFVLGCYAGWKRGPFFCRGVVEGFCKPWQCWTNQK